MADGKKTDSSLIDQKWLDFIVSDDLKTCDPQVNEIIELEDERQFRKLILIASESMSPLPVRMALASNFVNIYAEGYPSYRMIRDIDTPIGRYDRQLSFLRRYSDRRYYKGVEYVDLIESLAQRRAARCFATDEIPAEEIFVNVQPLSGAAANNAVYEAFVRPGDVVMGMDLTHGGHLTHGSHANRSGKNYHIIPYRANYDTGEIDYESLHALALQHRPKLIIAGYSAYPKAIDWKRFKEIAHSVGAILLADIAHPAGLVAGRCFPSPVGHADVISFTTHKTLCGPRGAVLLTTNEEYSRKIDNAVFPGEQGGPHVNTIAAKAVLFKIAQTEQYRSLQKQVLQNSKDLAASFKDLGLKLAYGGTDSHMVLIDMRSIRGPQGDTLKGEIASRLLDLCGITCNKNTIPGDTNAAHPNALRFGTTWITQRGFGKKEIERMASIIHQVISNMKPYKYIEAQGDVGRAKIDQAILDKAQKDVHDLIMSLPARPSASSAGTGYPHFHPLAEESTVQQSPLTALHQENRARLENISGCMIPLYYTGPEENPADAMLVDCSDNGLIEIWGDRSHLFIEEICTGATSKLHPGELMHTFILDDDGRIIDDVVIIRMHDDEQGLPHFILKTGAHRHAALVRRLRALSDGYVLFHAHDLYAKIQGPAIIDDLNESRDTSRQLTILGLYGKKARAVLNALGCQVPEKSYTELKAGSVEFAAAPLVIGGQEAGFDLFVAPARAAALWESITEKGKELGLQPCGVIGREKFRSSLKLPDYKKELTIDDTLALYRGGYSGSFALSSPYFIGQKALLKHISIPSSKKAFHYEEKEEAPLTTCLYEEHRKLTRKLVPFAGYTMPVWYTSINEEHRAVRERAGLFDVSHMGALEIKGRDATRFLDAVGTNYTAKLMPGQSEYSSLLDHRGDTIDDIMIYRRGPEHYMVIVNAANTKKVLAWLRAVIAKEVIIDEEYPHKELDFDVTLRDLKDEACDRDRKVDIAIQGPRSIDTLLKMMKDGKDLRRLRQLKKTEFFETHLAGKPAIISRTGYTGEDIAYELYIHPDDAVYLWNALLEAGREFGLIPTGLGSRDSTRTEAGLPLYGHELAGPHNITSNEAGYASFIKFHKPFFIGRESVIKKAEKQDREIIRFRMCARGIKIVKNGDPLVTRKGDYIGTVTSCVTIDGVQMGLALVKSRYAQPGSKVCVFILPRDAKALEEKAKDKLASGDRLLLHEDALILSRFPLPGENEAKTDRE